MIDAVVMNDTIMASQLIDSGAPVNIRGRDRSTLLHVAVKWDKPRVMKLLHEKYVDVSWSFDEKVLKSRDIFKKPIDMPSLLLRGGADANASNRQGDTPIHTAIKSMQVDADYIPSIPPVLGRISSPFGWRGSPLSKRKESDYHRGIDIAAPGGKPIVAVGSGVVEGFAMNEGYGNFLVIRHRNGVKSLYGHCHMFKVLPNDRVRRGDLIAYVGNTGNSTGDHCHYEVWVNGIPVDPSVFLGEKSAAEISNRITCGIVRLLIDYKAEVNVKNGKGRTPLLEAAGRSVEIAMVLLGAGAEVNVRDNDGVTPLHEAAAFSDDLVKIIIKRGCPVNTRTKSRNVLIAGMEFPKGTTALSIAKKAGKNGIAQILQNHGAVE